MVQQPSAEEDALEPDVIEMPGDDQRERDDGAGPGARIIVLNPRGETDAPIIDEAFDEVLSPWDILHLRWRLRERLNRWREESSDILSQFERASKQAAVVYLKTLVLRRLRISLAMRFPMTSPGQGARVSLDFSSLTFFPKPISRQPVAGASMKNGRGSVWGSNSMRLSSVWKWNSIM